LVQSPKESVAFLRQQLRPVQPADTKEIIRLIAELDSDRYLVREKASAQLLKHSLHAVAAMEKVLDNRPTLEVRLRLEQVLSKIENHTLPGGMLQAMRALEALEMQGTTDAVSLLETLSRGEADAWLTREAAAALQRVRDRAMSG